MAATNAVTAVTTVPSSSRPALTRTPVPAQSATWREVGRRQRTRNPELVAQGVGDELPERGGVSLPAEAADPLPPIGGPYPVRTPVDAIAPRDCPRGDLVIRDRVDEPSAVQIRGVAHGGHVSARRDPWREIATQTLLGHRAAARHRPAATDHRVEAT